MTTIIPFQARVHPKTPEENLQIALDRENQREAERLARARDYVQRKQEEREHGQLMLAGAVFWIIAITWSLGVLACTAWGFHYLYLKFGGL